MQHGHFLGEIVSTSLGKIEARDVRELMNEQFGFSTLLFFCT
jgi:hypothetical protein